jgi:hydrogenase maturation protein HypF
VPLSDGLPPLAVRQEGALSADERRIVEKQVAAGLNAPPTSSMGRLFDAAAAIAGVRQQVNYEGQAAIELEALVAPAESGQYEFEVSQGLFQAGPVIRAVAADTLSGVPVGVIAARFHNAVAAMIQQVCLRLREQRGLNQVALSGGVFQNMTLLAKTLELLRASEFEVFTHQLVPPNDGGLALGQAVIAAGRLGQAGA